MISVKLSSYTIAKNLGSMFIWLLVHSAPPSGCQGAGVVSVTATVITIVWEKPEQIGREDFYYTVHYKELAGFSGITAGPYINYSDHVEYTVDGLQPSTEYVFRITVHNSVSDQDFENEESRVCETVASTADIGECKIYRVPHCAH